MSKEELIEYLKEHIRIEVEDTTDIFDISTSIEVIIKIDDNEVLKESFYI